jgi:hypothetical protein
MSAYAPGAQLIADLSNLLRTPSCELHTVQRRWPEIEASLRKERSAILKHIPHDDPIRDATDLLGPLKFDTDEVLHTRALAYLFRPLASHGFGCRPLQQFLAEVLKMPEARGSIVAEIIASLMSACATVTTSWRNRRRAPTTFCGGTARRIWLYGSKTNS